MSKKRIDSKDQRVEEFLTFLKTCPRCYHSSNPLEEETYGDETLIYRCKDCDERWLWEKWKSGTAWVENEYRRWRLDFTWSPTKKKKHVVIEDENPNLPITKT